MHRFADPLRAVYPEPNISSPIGTLFRAIVWSFRISFQRDYRMSLFSLFDSNITIVRMLLRTETNPPAPFFLFIFSYCSIATYSCRLSWDRLTLKQLGPTWQGRNNLGQ